ncbi:MAG: hypothetical protein Q4A90_03885 [Streptococcus sp.]|nr:hypothetical protein [Streptococcus sp.]
MYNKIFGELTYDFGFNSKINIEIFERKNKVIVTAQAYRESDGISREQEDSFSKFKNNMHDIIGTVEDKIINNYGQHANSRFNLTTIVVDRQGELALIFDDKEDEDEGIVVQVFPKYIIQTQSSYL